MKKIFNYRPIFYSFVALALGIFFARDIFYGKIFVIIGLFAGFLALLLVSIFTKHIKRILAGIIAFAIGIGVFVLTNYSFNNLPFENGVYTVSGRINTVNDYSSSQAVILDNVYIDGQKINKCIKVFVNGATALEEGYVITFTDYLEKTSLFTLGQFNNYEYKYQIAYSVSTDNYEIDKFDGLTISESLRNSVKNVLLANLGKDEASVCYASLFGDKSLIDGNIKDTFSISGIAHLLAVSGLHVGFLAGLLSFLTRKVPNRAISRPLIITPILLFYCYLCSFSSSVVRATIMFLVLTIADSFGKRYDRLNALGLAGFAVLLYKPLSVYDPGFLLSFFCVLSIIMFMPHISSLFGKIKKFPKWLKDSLAVIFSVQIGMLPLTIYYYGQISFMSILANFLCVPVFEVFFTLLVMCLPIVLILPFLNFILIAPSVIISGIMAIAKWCASQTWAIVYLAWIPVILIVAIYFCMFIMSHFTGLKFSHKIIYSGLILLFVGIIAIGNSLPTKQNFGITVINTFGEYSCVLEFGGEKYLVSEYNYYESRDAGIYFSSVVNDNAECLFYLDEKQVYDVDYYKNTYKSAQYEDDGVLAYNQKYDFKKVSVTPISIDLTLCGYLFECNTYKVFVAHKNANAFHVASAINDTGGINILFCTSQILVDDVIFDAEYIIYDGITVINKQNEKYTMTGNWTINLENDKLLMRGID